MAEQSDIKIQFHTRLREPDMYMVIMHNDDFTTMEFVVEVLKTVFHKEQNEAEVLMMTVHKKGNATVGIYTYDIAMTKSQKAMQMARNAGFPFKLTVEPEELPF